MNRFDRLQLAWLIVVCLFFFSLVYFFPPGVVCVCVCACVHACVPARFESTVQTEIAKRLNAIIAQVLPFLSAEVDTSLSVMF